MSTKNVLWLIQNLSPTFKFLLSRHTMSTLKNKALALQMAEVKTTKCCSHFTCVKITQKKAAGIFSHRYTLNSLQTSDPLIWVPPSPTFCCMDQHKDWFTILICSILQIIIPSCFSRYRQLNQITELQLLNSFRVLLKGLVIFKYLCNWTVFKYCEQVFQQFLVETTEGKKIYD